MIEWMSTNDSKRDPVIGAREKYVDVDRGWTVRTRLVTNFASVPSSHHAYLPPPATHAIEHYRASSCIRPLTKEIYDKKVPAHEQALLSMRIKEAKNSEAKMR